jgi:AraC family transcriptional regulator of arabinose operon
MSLLTSFFRDNENSPRFSYNGGGVTAMQKEPGTWRVLPISLVAQIKYGDVWVYQEGEEPYVIGAGEAICIPAGVHHKIDNHWEGINSSRWCHMNVFILGSVDMMTLVDIPRIFSGKTAQLIGDINEELTAIYSLEQPEFKHILRQQMLGYQLAEIVVGASKANAQAQRLLPYLERLSPVLNYIQENLMHPLSREELANQVFLSPSRFYALFKEAFGISPTDYIQGARMQQAQRLLLNAGLSVHDVAESCGYPNAFHFSRLFKKRFGMSPLQYRRSIGWGWHADRAGQEWESETA